MSAWYRGILSAVLILTLLVVVGAMPAAAQTPHPDKDESCMTCHENLYVLYDTGKWYCMCGTRARCTYCHGGTLNTLDETTAHTGLIANPVRDNRAACQTCHPDDYQAHIDKFIAIGGVRQLTSLTSTTAYTYTTASFEPQTSFLEQQPMAPWKVAGLALAGLGLIGAGIYALHCCLEERRADKENT